MKLRELNEAQITTVNFSDLQHFDNFDARFWVGMKEYINQYKKLGKDKSLDFIVAKIKKIGEDNYNSMKAISDKNRFGVPPFETASNKAKLKKYESGAGKLVVLMDLVQSKAKIRKTKLEAELKDLEKKIAQLED